MVKCTWCISRANCVVKKLQVKLHSVIAPVRTQSKKKIKIASENEFSSF